MLASAWLACRGGSGRLAGFKVDSGFSAILSARILVYFKSVLAFERENEVEAAAVEASAASTVAAEEKRMSTVVSG